MSPVISPNVDKQEAIRDLANRFSPSPRPDARRRGEGL
jgi:hypothetical protein